MLEFEDKVVLVTGATGGIGKAIASHFHALGATIVITGTRQNVLDELAAEFKERVIIKAADMSVSSEVIELYKFAENEAGKVDVLVCNAGITKDGLAMRMSEDDWDAVLNVNLKSVFLLNREALKAMSKRRSGRVINISSIVGVTGNFGQANYVSAKAGLIGMTKTFALESATRGLTFNAIAPGFIETPMTAKLSEDFIQKIAAKIPMGFQGSPADIAHACAFLASDGARYITGQTLHVNGGMCMI